MQRTQNTQMQIKKKNLQEKKCNINSMFTFHDAMHFLLLERVYKTEDRDMRFFAFDSFHLSHFYMRYRSISSMYPSLSTKNRGRKKCESEWLKCASNASHNCTRWFSLSKAAMMAPNQNAFGQSK